MSSEAQAIQPILVSDVAVVHCDLTVYKCNITRKYGLYSLGYRTHDLGGENMSSGCLINRLIFGQKVSICMIGLDHRRCCSGQ